jgi:hypothetical protein
MFKFEKTLNTHLAQAQLYRWYQLYERELNEKRISNQMEILADDVVVKSAAGEMKGKLNYPARLAAYKGWQNAHHVQNVSVSDLDKDTIGLEADIKYQNIQADGQKRSYTIHYTTQLIKTKNKLPLFSSLDLKPIEETKDEFTDAYLTNRAKSLMHYWLANMELLDGNVTPFKELLTDDLLLNFTTSGQINSIEKLEVWLNDAPKQLSQSSHHPENFSIKQILENEYKMTVEFDWYGITKDGKKMTARTKHIWYLIDNINDRFAKIKRIDVMQIEPFKTIE